MAKNTRPRVVPPMPPRTTEVHNSTRHDNAPVAVGDFFAVWEAPMRQEVIYMVTAIEGRRVQARRVILMPPKKDEAFRVCTTGLVNDFSIRAVLSDRRRVNVAREGVARGLRQTMNPPAKRWFEGNTRFVPQTAHPSYEQAPDVLLMHVESGQHLSRPDEHLYPESINDMWGCDYKPQEKEREKGYKPLNRAALGY